MNVKFDKNLLLFVSVLVILVMLVMAFSACSAETSEDKEVLDDLVELKGLNGQWNIDKQVIVSGSGDLFALSQTEVDDFVFQTDVIFQAQKGAASLVFYATDNPSSGSYVANIDIGAGNARIFKFESEGQATTKGEYVLSTEERSSNEFNIRVEAINGYIIYFLNGNPVVKVKDFSSKPGRKLGLLNYDTSLVFSNIGYMEIKRSDPELEEIQGNGIDFDGQSFLKTKVPFGTQKFELDVSNEGNIGARICGGSGSETVKLKDGKLTIEGISSTGFSLIIEITRGEKMRSYVLDVDVEQNIDELYNEELRPQLHFTPLKNWMNDPNGLVYDPSDSSWHLFYQYNPYGLNIANQVWGHAVSRDLVNWRELDIAIAQDELGAVFSGSAVVDEDNTSGFFTYNKPGESKLVALYTSDGGDRTHGTEKQCIAYSKDHGVTWIKPSLQKDGFENPILPNDGNTYGVDFRDPKIFRYDGKWFMALAGGRARLFTSDDLINWTLVCDMGFDSECPDFYPLALDGDENNIKWVYVASGKWYVVGRLEKISEYSYRFLEESGRVKYNGGNEMYATQSYYNDGTGQNRRIAISWIQDDSAASVPSKGWNGVQSLPLEQRLVTVNGNMVLTSYPVEEINSLRNEKIVDIENADEQTVNEKLELVSTDTYDFVLTFVPEEQGSLTLTLRSNGQNATRIIYEAEQNKLRVVRSDSSHYGGNIPTSDMEMPLYADENGRITLRIIMDTSVIEVFGNDGQAACCGSIFPGPDCTHSSISFSDGFNIEKIEVWNMDSIWHK